MLGKIVQAIVPLHEIATPASDSVRNTGSGAPAPPVANSATRGAPSSADAQHQSAHDNQPSQIGAVSALASGARVARREHVAELQRQARLQRLRDAEREDTRSAAVSAMPPPSVSAGATSNNGSAEKMRPLRKSKRLRTSVTNLPPDNNSSIAPKDDKERERSAKAARTMTRRTPSNSSSRESSVASSGSSSDPLANLDADALPYAKIAGVCNQENIIWTKIKGHPYWPTQVVRLSDKLLSQKRFKNSLRFRRKTDDTCVMYFGTCEIAWISREKATIPWLTGVRNGLHRVNKLRHAYQLALEEVKGYCARLTKYPRTWWCEPPCFALAAEFQDEVGIKGFESRHASMFTRARQERVCWVKMRGYPHWPVQVLPTDIAIKDYPELKMRPPTPGTPPSSYPCMFFGTGEVAMVVDKGITPFDVGAANDFVMASDRHDFTVAIGDAWGYLKKPRVWPSGFLSGRLWWNDTNPTSSDDEREGDTTAKLMRKKDIPEYEYIRKSVWAQSLQPKSPPKKNEPAVCACVPSADHEPGTRYCADMSCLNVVSHFFCDQRICPAKEKCENIPFHRRKSPRLKPFYTTDQRGWGLRVDVPLKRGDFVIEYVGEIIDKKTCEKRLKDTQRQGKSEYYMMEVDNDIVLDAQHRGNLSRFINSSCAPNCSTQKWTDVATGQTHVGIFALQDIKAGTEVTYDYCFQDFGLASLKKKRSFVCRCRADTCCMLEPEERRWVTCIVGKRVAVKWDDGWFHGTVESYDAEKKKFKVLYDDGDHEELTFSLPFTAPDGIQHVFLDENDKKITVSPN